MCAFTYDVVSLFLLFAELLVQESFYSVMCAFTYDVVSLFLLFAELLVQESFYSVMCAFTSDVVSLFLLFAELPVYDWSPLKTIDSTQDSFSFITEIKKIFWCVRFHILSLFLSFFDQNFLIFLFSVGKIISI